MDIFLLYLFTRLDILSSVFGGLGVAAVIAFIAALIGSFLALDKVFYSEGSYEEDARLAKATSAKLRKLARNLAIASILLFMLEALTPTQKDVMFIVGGKIGIDIVQSDEVKETSAKLYELLHKKLDQVLVD